MKVVIQVYNYWYDWATIDPKEIETDNYDYFELENRGDEKSWYLIGYKWNRTDDPRKGDGYWSNEEWDIIDTIKAVEFYNKIPEKIHAIKGYSHHHAVKMFIDAETRLRCIV